METADLDHDLPFETVFMIIENEQKNVARRNCLTLVAAIGNYQVPKRKATPERQKGVEQGSDNPQKYYM